ncbi:MAG: peptide MFS transporter [Elusimicrobiota bacterium]|jgi:POT family proton-dependent oligopeptide transporter|nr:peptide MFS transporter [Elusimicrobiota bacterium]
MQNIKKNHPAGLWLLCAVETLERFAYYAMRAMLVLYFVYTLKLSVEKSSYIYGVFNALVYLSAFIGGYMSDKFTGQKKAVVLGCSLMTLGFFAFSVENMFFIYGAMFLLVLGNGFFKPNMATLISTLYDKNDPRQDAGFTYFYMAINVGAFFSAIPAGLGEQYGWKYGFWAAGAAMMLALAVMLWGQGKWLKGKGDKPARVCQKESGPVVKTPLTIDEKKKIAVIFIMSFFSIFFFSAYEQSGTALNLFAFEATERVINLFGRAFEIPATWFQSLNPLFIVLLSPVLAKLWVGLAQKGKEPSTPMKFVWGTWLLGLGFVALLFAAMKMGPGIKVSMIYLIVANLVFSLGELCLSPVGLSLVCKLSPAYFVGFMMAVWQAAAAASYVFAGMYSGCYGKISDTKFFGILVAVLFVASMLMWFMVRPIKRWMGDVK